MPYQPGDRLPGEHASRLGHLEVLKSNLVQSLCKSFELPQSGQPLLIDLAWQPLEYSATPLNIIFGVDGSVQTIEDPTPPYKALAVSSQ